MAEFFNLAKRPEGYKLHGENEGATGIEWATFGPDSQGRYFSVIDTGSASQVKQRTEHGELSTFQQEVGLGDQFRCGALDRFGRVWVGILNTRTLGVLSPAGAWDTTLSLTDGSATFEPWGMLFDEEDGYLYVLGIEWGANRLRLFRVDVSPGAEAIVAFSAAVVPSGGVIPSDTMDIVKDPNGDYWTTDPTTLTSLIRFSGGYLAVTVAPLSVTANRGLHRIHYAFDHLWVGGDTTQGFGAGNPQILKVQLDGTVVANIPRADSLRLGGFASDAERLYVASSGFIGGSGPGTNKTLVVAPSGPTVDDEILFAGASPTQHDGLGAPCRNLLVVTEGEELEFPDPTLFDADIWFRGDDPQILKSAGVLHGLPNRGPQGLKPQLRPARGRPAMAAIGAKPALNFPDARGDSRLHDRPVYSLASTGFDDALSQRVSAGAAFDLEYTSSFSISLWVRGRGATKQAMLGKMDPPTTLRGYSIGFDAGGPIRFELHNDEGGSNSLAVKTTETGFNDGLWHHVCVVVTGTASVANTKIYVDNTDEPLTTISDTLSATTLNSGDFWIGARSATGDEEWFEGFITEVAIYSVALSVGDVEDIWNDGAPGDLALLTSAASLAGWFRGGTGDTYPKLLNMVAGTAVFPTIPDESGSGNAGTMTNMLASNIQVPVPWSNFSQYCYSFDGVNEYITMGDVLGFEYNLPCSVSFWFWATDAGLYRTAIGKVTGAPTYRGWWVSLAAGQIRWVLVNDSLSHLSSEIITDTAFNDGARHHVVCTYTAATPGSAADMNIFVDGVDVATTVVSNTLGSNTILTPGSLNISGYNDGAGNFFAGFLSDVAIYDAALDLTDAQWIYNSGEPRDLRLPAAPSGLAAYWRLGEASEVPQSSWTHKVQQWEWDATATKESVTITDASHLNSPGTLYNMVAGDVTTDTPGGVSEYSCTFDGINKGMYCNVASGVNLAYRFENYSVFSLAGWVKCSSGTSGWLWGNGTDSLANWAGYGVYLDSGKPKFVYTPNWVSGTSGLIVRTTTATVDDGDWHHVLVCYRYSTASASTLVDIYIDGVSVATTVLHGASTSSIGGSGFSVGARNLGQHEPVAAQCDEVAVWSKFLTQADATALYNGGAPTDLREHKLTTPFLIGWWRMGDPYFAPGTTVNMEYYDKIPTAPGAPVYTERSLYFDGGNDHVVVPTASAFDFDIADPFSLSAWICAWDTAAYAGIFAKGTSGAHWKIEYYGRYNYHQGALCRITMDGSTAGLIEAYIGGTWNQWPLPFAEWMHLVVTYDGSNDADNIKAYINGEEWPVYVRYNVAMAGTMQNSSDLWMGRASAYWYGHQDEMSIWDKELSQAAVTELFNGGDPADLSAHTSVANLVGWWRMGEGALDGTMVNMAPRALAPVVPEPTNSLDWMHKEGELTLLIAFYSGDTDAAQTVFSTLDSALTTSSTGFALFYDGTQELIRLVVANGGGVSYAVDYSTAAGSVPISTPLLLAVRLTKDATATALDVRIWAIPQPHEYTEEAPASFAATYSTGAAGDFVLGNSGEGSFKGELGEGMIFRRLLVDTELFELIRYLRRWLP